MCLTASGHGAPWPLVLNEKENTVAKDKKGNSALAEICTEDRIGVGFKMDIDQDGLLSIAEVEYERQATEALRDAEKIRDDLRETCRKLEDSAGKVVEAAAVKEAKAFWTLAENTCKTLGAKLERPKNWEQDARESVDFSISRGDASLTLRLRNSTSGRDEDVSVEITRRFNLWCSECTKSQKEYKTLQDKIEKQAKEVSRLKIALSAGELEKVRRRLRANLNARLIQESGDAGQEIYSDLLASAVNESSRLLAAPKDKK